jgi:hypothetical protein
MAIQEGIYMLWNAFNNEALDLSNGKWEYGQACNLLPTLSQQGTRKISDRD